MNYNDFAELLCEVISDELPADIYVKTREVLKNNGSVRRGIVFIEKDINASPTIYLEYHYELFERGMDVNDIALDIISKFYKNRLAEGVNVDFFSFFEQVSDNLYCKLINKEMNEEYLKDVPYEEFLDLAIVVYCKLNDFEFGDASITIRNEHLKLWSVSKDVVFNMAKENTHKKMKYKMENISVMLNTFAGDIMCDDEEPFTMDYNIPMYVITNEAKMMGAVFMIYEDILQSICDTLGDEYFILPSSIHEFIAVKKTDCDTKEYYDNMVCEVNAEHVESEEILANHAYLFNRSRGFLI